MEESGKSGHSGGHHDSSRFAWRSLCKLAGGVHDTAIPPRDQKETRFLAALIDRDITGVSASLDQTALCFSGCLLNIEAI